MKNGAEVEAEGSPNFSTKYEPRKVKCPMCERVYQRWLPKPLFPDLYYRGMERVYCTLCLEKQHRYEIVDLVPQRVFSPS
jgi:hypothetical protein